MTPQNGPPVGDEVLAGKRGFDVFDHQPLDECTQLLSLLLVLLGHRNQVIRNLMKIRMPFRVRMIANHQRNFASQFPDPLPVKQIHETVIIFGNKNGDARPVIRPRNAPPNRKLLGNGCKPLRKIFQIELEPFEIPFDARQIESLFPRLVLLEMQDVPAMPINKIRNGRIQTLSIRALQ